MYLSLLIMLLGGIAPGFFGHWWSKGWLCASIVILIVILVVMGTMASRHFHRTRKVVGLPYREGNKELTPIEPGSPEELDRLLKSGKPHLMSVIGIGGWAIILRLMLFKLF